MQLFTQIRTRLHNSLLTKEMLSHQTPHRSASLENAKTVGILFDGTQLEDREAVLKFAEQQKREGKKLSLLAFIDNDLKDQQLAFHFFNRRDLDFALRPKSQDAIKFMQQPFDILLNLSNESIVPLDYIAAHSHAGFRAGPHTEKLFCYELMIEPSGKKNLSDFLRQIAFYLNKIKPEYEKAIV